MSVMRPLFSWPIKSISNETDIKRYLFILIAIWTLPWPFQFPGAGLDPSWLIGINRAFLENLQFGKDIAFTFGPLGFTWGIPLLLDYNIWRFALVFSIFNHLLLTYSIYTLFKRHVIKYHMYAIFIPLLVLSMSTTLLDYRLNISIFLLIYMFICSPESQNSQSRTYAYIIFMGLLLSTSSLIKFNMFILSISTIFATIISLLLLRRNILYGICLSISYLFFLILLWMFIGQDIINLVPFFLKESEIFRGYNDAMAIKGPDWQIYVGLISIAFIFIIFIISTLNNNWKTYIFLILSSNILFASFKHGFVRHDLHVFGFFQIYLLFLGLILLIIIDDTNKIYNDLRYINIFIIMMISASMIYISPSVLDDNVIEKVDSYKATIQFLQDPEAFYSTVAAHRELIKSQYQIDENAILYIGNDSIDIFPWDVSLCEAYDLNWSPRPVFQSYSTYTNHLDMINSRHFIGTKSPKMILYAYKSIDGRYPLFDEPATIRTIIFNYEYITEAGEFVLLKKSPNSREMSINEVDLGGVTTKLGEIIQIPEYDGFIFGYVCLDYSLRGIITKFIYKPSPVYIQFNLSNDYVISQKYRFIPDTAQNGIFLSKYVENTHDLATLFCGEINSDINDIIIVTDNPEHYSETVTIRFVGVPIKNKSSYIYNIYQSYIPIDNLECIRSGIGLINNKSKYIIFEHPKTLSEKPIISTGNILIPKNAKLRFSIALDPHVWSSDKGDGVLFEINISVDDDIEKILFSEYIDPKNNPNEQEWNEFEIDLSAYSDKYAIITFSTLPGPDNDARYDWSWWGEPIILQG